MTHERITLFAGHYGSGKTNLAVNYAAALKRLHPDRRVILADLDIVNPYFRSLDSADVLGGVGVEVIASRFANSNLEAPSMPGEAITIFDDKSCLGVIDVGGDDRGAYAVGKYADYIREEDASVLLVCNKYRPLSRDPRQVLAIKNEIESAARIKFTGVVNNSNLGGQTSPEDILSSLRYISDVSELCGLPVAFTGAARGLIDDLPGIDGLFPLEIYGKKEWQIN
ncbi:MAG: hypothetical protein LBS84_08285 [Clostridiales bacterium]|jgi:hypothetical protein|nr:hypothetical protein [Clostridiales bacterium]